MEAKELAMLSHKELDRIREEREVMETWRTYSRHVVAEMLEACSICGTLREKDQLSRCRWCEDTYICKEGVCAQQHQAELHPAVAFWTW
jgi:recombinational DNA repair protein RecR